MFCVQLNVIMWHLRIQPDHLLIILDEFDHMNMLEEKSKEKPLAWWLLIWCACAYQTWYWTIVVNVDFVCHYLNENTVILVRSFVVLFFILFLSSVLLPLFFFKYTIYHMPIDRYHLCYYNKRDTQCTFETVQSDVSE